MIIGWKVDARKRMSWPVIHIYHCSYYVLIWFKNIYSSIFITFDGVLNLNAFYSNILVLLPLWKYTVIPHVCRKVMWKTKGSISFTYWQMNSLVWANHLGMNRYVIVRHHFTVSAHHNFGSDLCQISFQIQLP